MTSATAIAVAATLGLLGAAARCSASTLTTMTVKSPALSKFWGRPISVGAYVLLPRGYNANAPQPYPVLYYISGFDERHAYGGSGRPSSAQQYWWSAALRSAAQPFVIVSLGGMFGGAHTVFADSANDGPWSTAFVNDIAPAIETEFHCGGAANRRFIAGHSSGGWAALWLQVNYPSFFAGVWSISPDPVDFHDFMGADLTRPSTNMYRDAAGRPRRIAGMDAQAFANENGWKHAQFLSFNTVFSPRGLDGKPEPLFDWRSGAIDPHVAAYWEAHYDIATLLREHWSAIGPNLEGKIHIIIGSKDQFDLLTPVRLLAADLQNLGARAEFVIVDGANHFVNDETAGGVFTDILLEAAATPKPAPLLSHHRPSA